MLPPAGRSALLQALGLLLLLPRSSSPTSSLTSTPTPTPTPVGGASCLLAADLVSCGGRGLALVPARLPRWASVLDLSHNGLVVLEAGSLSGLARLHTLNLAHNRLRSVQPGAFANASGALLRHLDLSSNRLVALEGGAFLELGAGLEELLLFDNRLVRVEAALAPLAALRLLYLGHNQLAAFQVALLRRRHARLALLDLSHNHLRRLDVVALRLLPGALRLYLHANPLACGCAPYRLLRRWRAAGAAGVTHFLQQHVCRLHGAPPGRLVRFFPEKGEGRGFFHSPSPSHPDSGGQLTFLWMSPHEELLATPPQGGSGGGALRVLANGSLQIVAAAAEDAGTYWCMALDRQRRRNHTWEVNVTVVGVGPGAGPGGRGFNTGWTTLLGCLVSLLLLLLYLYLTPCRCRPRPPADPAPDTTHSSDPAPPPPPGRQGSANKRVVFLEPASENVRPGAGPGGGACRGHLGPELMLGAEPQQLQPGGAETDWPDRNLHSLTSSQH
ncbi:amphoterin-induced protein 3-like [Nelusetta ayraudi]|uniref:amphoterin-induced protein 3-like n=1 Tax=Nelusetta ayraudi TaxID=303726 RepID=UPI003F707F60